MAIARVIRTATGIVVALIVIAIILRVVSANPHNTIVSDIHDAGQWLTGPFHNIFSVRGAKWNLALNWGLAAVIYAIVGGFLASLLARGAAQSRFTRARPVA
jgi:CDP-diglyceride synthetase